MPTLTVDLAKTYSLSQGKATRVDWGGIDGKNKLRRFFVHPKWQDYIAHVSVSSAGAKGGVFFLEAYTVTREALEQQMRTLGVEVAVSGVWRLLHGDGHLAGGLVGPRESDSLAATGTTALPAVVHPRVMQGITLKTSTYYGRNVAARAALVTALQNAAELKKRYVVKGTNEPGRTLFAEYVLNAIGKAKIPKSLVLEIDPSRPSAHADPSEGMIMLDLIDTKRAPGVDAARYDATYAGLRDGGQSVVDYLVVQKLLTGDTITGSGELLEEVRKFLYHQKIRVGVDSFTGDQRFDNESRATLKSLAQELGVKKVVVFGRPVDDYKTRLAGVQTLSNRRDEVEAVLEASALVLGENGLRPGDYAKGEAGQFDQLVRDLQGQDTALARALAQCVDVIRPLVATNRRILSNVYMMWNSSRVHFADALLGNGDRFRQFNTGNMFYVTEPTSPHKTTNPVGCIDNDSFLPTYLPSDVDGGFDSAANYVATVLSPAAELWGWESPKPDGMVMAPNMNLHDVLDNDTWFNIFFMAFMARDLPAAVLELYGADFFERGDHYPFANTQALRGWTQVRNSLREGAANTLARYLDTDLGGFRAVYDAMTGRYYPGPNFEFTAFEIRDRYLRNYEVDRQNWTISSLGDAKVRTCRAEIRDWLIEVRRVNPECDAPGVSSIAERALSAGVGADINCISAADAAEIRRLLRTLAVSDQELLLPYPFASGLIPSPSAKKARKEFDDKWTGLKRKYQVRLTVVICTLLRRFRNEYIAEVGYLTNDRGRIVQSHAFNAAVALGRQVSDLRLAKDELNTQPQRHQVLGVQLQLPHHVTAT